MLMGLSTLPRAQEDVEHTPELRHAQNFVSALLRVTFLSVSDHVQVAV